jgi:hypothetical protein
MPSKPGCRGRRGAVPALLTAERPPSVGRGQPGLRRAGYQRSPGCLRSLLWERFLGGGAGNRSPRLMRGPVVTLAGPTVGLTASRTPVRTPRTGRASPAGKLDQVTRGRQASRENSSRRAPRALRAALAAAYPARCRTARKAAPGTAEPRGITRCSTREGPVPVSGRPRSTARSLMARCPGTNSPRLSSPSLSSISPSSTSLSSTSLSSTSPRGRRVQDRPARGRDFPVSRERDTARALMVPLSKVRFPAVSTLPA